jgi:predicted DNA-binding protein (UPF0251 family)
MLLAITLVSPVYADTTFTDEEAATLIVEVEKGRLCNSISDSQNKMINELMGQGQILSSQIDECNNKVQACIQTIDAKDLIIKTQDEECKKLIEVSRGTFWSRLKSNMGVFGTGAISGVALAALLLLLL